MFIEGWGRYPKVDSDVVQPSNAEETQSYVTNASTSLIARGNGRSYGDSALQESVISTRKMNAIEDFDQENGVIKVQAGLLIDELLQHIIPKGWFPFVVPGTRMVTIGGAIASNIHGKNHHVMGAFGDYVLSLELLDANGQVQTCSRDVQPALFRDTIGGLGLTGIILRASFQLAPIETAFYRQQAKVATDLSDMLRLFEQNKEMPYLVAWLDGLVSIEQLGAGTLLMGQSCKASELPTGLQQEPRVVHQGPSIRIPRLPVSWLMNPLSLWLNNTLYKWKNRPTNSGQVVHYSQFFFPLDALSNWNRLYGPAGLLQYQFVVGFTEAEECIRSILVHLHQSGLHSYLLVLKRMGSNKSGSAPTDFPMPGYSLAIDLKNTAKARQVLGELDPIVIRYEGRVYLTKDARLPAESFKQMYPEATNNGTRFQSLQSQRIYDL